MSIIWKCKDFQDLSSLELYKILQLRINVFMLEQNCLYPECDDKDLKAQHLFAISDDKIVAYSRLLPNNTSYSERSIGRVIVSEDARGSKLGYSLMQRSIETLTSDNFYEAIRISAQEHLQRFYESLGFHKVSESYLEDGIPHIEMLYQKTKEE